MPLKRLLFSQKSSAVAVRHNPKYASVIFFLRFLLQYFLIVWKQTYQIFGKAIFQDVSEDVTLPYDLISLFTSI